MLRITFALLTLPCLALGLGMATAAGASDSDAPSVATYLANAGVVVTRGDVKIAFDPLFKTSFGQYALMTTEMEEMFLEGQAPYDGLDAIFVSHLHGDHIDPGLVATILQKQPELHLYAPEPAAKGVLMLARDAADAIRDRVHGISLEVGDAPFVADREGLAIEAVRIPHSGWPDGMTTVENLAFRVTLAPDAEEPTTVVHLGDSDARDEHFATHDEYWKKRTLDLALPPYWFLATDGGAKALERLAPSQVVGVHVPTGMTDPAKRGPKYEGDDLFVKAGETREIGE
ncbi:MAG: MBL fold metallo-hydrolase [Acidobacteriota bacterium]